MQSFPGGFLEDQAGPSQVSGVWEGGSVGRLPVYVVCPNIQAPSTGM